VPQKTKKMKILVCISKTPDTTTKISFTDNNTRFNEERVQWIVNPYDEWYSLVRGLELKEANGGSVTTISVGNADYDPIIRKALAIGADNAVRIDAEPGDASFVARQIAEYAKDKGFDLVFTGKETLDFNGYQVGAMIAEALDLPFVSTVHKLDVDGNKAKLDREIQGGMEVVEVEMPIVLSSAKDLAEQRIPNMRGIMSARTKPLEVIAPAAIDTLTEAVAFSLPPEKGSCKYIDAENAGELIELLHSEAKVI
jgi:electron transfer flavoprotein beta subunit